MTNKLITLANWVEVLLDIMESSRRDRSEDRGHFHELAIKHFSPVEPLLADDTLPSKILRSEAFERNFFIDALPSDVGNWDISLMGRPAQGDEDEVRFSLTRFRKKPLSELRGIPVPSSWIGEFSFGLLKHTGGRFTARAYVAWTAGGWKNFVPSGLRLSSAPGDFYLGPAIALNGQPWKPSDEEIISKSQLFLGLAFTRYYEWTVVLGRENGIAVKFVTDPEGARAAFRLRDIPEGKERRAALRNWIMEHWRKNRKTEEKDIKVRQHLRGAVKFNWNGLICEIEPSAYDVKRDALLRDRREQEKQAAREWAARRYGPQAYSWQ